jgi:glycosyltransferase involved in cell wall biosynthesis
VTVATRVCFLALDSYPILAGNPEAFLGGAEVQQCLIAQYLARRGYEVSFVSWDYGQPDGAIVDGITVYNACRLGAGLRYLRFLYPRWTSIWNALRRANADIYYQRCAGIETGLLAAFCRRHQRKFVFAAASETDFDLERVIIPNRIVRWLYMYGLCRTAAIVTQTERQSALLRQNFGLEACLIPNCWAEEPAAPKPSAEPGFVLWVSTMRTWKRPELFLDLAEDLPEVRFVMAGGPAGGEGALFAQAEKRARGITNLSFVGLIPFREIGHYFDHASLVVNTSEPKEGFPNTFLQAWCRGLPVVSFFDPDGVIRRHHLGLAVDSPDAMRHGVLELMHDAGLYEQMQRNALEYFTDNHRIDRLGPRYEALFDGLMV